MALKSEKMFLKARRIKSVTLTILGLLFLCVTILPQTKPAATFKDYGQWESLVAAGSYGGFSPDAKWLTYAINRSNGEDELRIVKLADGTTTEAAFGMRPVFSSNSQWVAYLIGMSEAEQEKLRIEKKPVENRFGLMNLASGETFTLERIQSFSFSRDGAFLAMQRYAPKSAASPSEGTERGTSREPEEKVGNTLIVRNLASGADTTFGNVSQFVWQDSDNSHYLAMTISAEGKAGNGVHLFDPETGILRVLDSSSSIYKGLAWKKDAADLCVFKAKEDEGREGSTHILLAWRGIGQKENMFLYDPTEDPNFPKDKRTVSFRPLTWSDDGRALFFGIANWEEKVQSEKSSDEKTDKEVGTKTTEDPSTVEIWHWTDVYVMPWQKVHARQDRRRNMLSVWHLEKGKFVQLGQDPIHERVTLIPKTELAYAAEWSKYAMERSIGRPGADLYLLDIKTGERTKLLENINDRYVRVGPDSKYLLFLQDKHYWTIDLSNRGITNITKDAPVSFIDAESDLTLKIYPDRLQKPPFGIAGWTKSDASVLIYDEYDIWQVASDGSKVVRLTEGTDEDIRHRILRLNENAGRPWWRGFSSGSVREEGIDLSEPVYLSLYGEWNKKSGFARLEPNGDITRLIWLPKHVASLAKAKEAEVYRYIVQDYDDPPDIFVADEDLKGAEQVTTTNAFQEEFAWGHSELIEYRTDKGRRLQGALFYPAGYEAGKKYPMIVYNYELLSQNVHRYVVPSDRSYYNISVFTSQGYLVLEPDIVFRPRQPGWSVVECITAGVDKVIEMGVVDPKRIGIVGHSMGGFNTAFVATHTNGIFAAAVAGAPITNLVSYYGDHHWGSGIAETDHIETGQERMEVALYEDLQAYIDNSAVYNVHNMTTPLLLEAGDVDGIIAWYQSIELYNIGRRAKKNVVLLGYIGEDHGLRKKSNQQDYQRRILAWFGHYLKGDPAEDWIVKGKSFLERETELKKLKEKK
jgi:dipeptidyl aminopeptidase/acylaminoacyl peptidase